MNDKQIIDQYFNNYFSNKKKKIYNEDLLTGFAIGAFLYFLFYILLRTFTVNKYEKEAITTKLEDNPKQVQQIIKFLDEIKRIIKNDITNKKLDKAFNIIDSLDNSLLSFKKNNDSQKSQQIVTSIIDNIKLLLEEILNLYGDQNKEKKENIFNKLKFILNQFGLSQKFELILKQVLENNNNIIKNDEKENVTVKPEEVENVIASDASNIKNEVINVIDREEVNMSDLPPDEDEEAYDIDEDEDEIPESDTDKRIRIDTHKSILKNKKDFFIQKVTEAIKPIILAFILEISNKNSNVFDDEDITAAYTILTSNKNIRDTSEEFYDTDILKKGSELVDEAKSSRNYTYLIDFFETENILIVEQFFDQQVGSMNDFNFNLKIKIHRDKFIQGIISPIKINENNNSDDFYILTFISGKNKNTFNIKMTKEQEKTYELYYNTGKIPDFIIESTNLQEYNIEICNGSWLIDPISNQKQNKKYELKFRTPTFNKKFGEMTQIKNNYQIIIFKNTGNFFVEVRPPGLTQENIEKDYCFCIRIDNNYYLKEIKKDFYPNVTSELKKTGKITYNSIHGLKHETHEEIKRLITKYTANYHNKNFLEFNPKKDNTVNEFNLEFFKINNNAIEERTDTSKNTKIYISTTVPNWDRG